MVGEDTDAVLSDKRFIPDAVNLNGNTWMPLVFKITDSLDEVVFNTICKESAVLLVEEKDCFMLLKPPVTVGFKLLASDLAFNVKVV